jgi:hypothetical protein
MHDKYEPERFLICISIQEDWIDLAQDRDQWRALVREVMNLWVP